MLPRSQDRAVLTDRNCQLRRRAGVNALSDDREVLIDTSFPDQPRPHIPPKPTSASFASFTRSETLDRTQDESAHFHVVNPQREKDSLLPHSLLPDDEERLPRQSSGAHDHAKQFQQAQKFLKELSESKIHLPEDEPIKFRVPNYYWQELRREPEFDVVRQGLKIPIAYDSSSSTLTVFPMSGDRHSVFLAWLDRFASHAMLTLDPKIQQNLRTRQNLITRKFDGDWLGSSKAPDYSIMWRKSDENRILHTVIEVGVSQTTQALREWAVAYLRGSPEVARVVLIDIAETPRYKQPDMEINELMEPDQRKFRYDPQNGAVFYGPAILMGETKITWEVWERSQVGNPVHTFKETIAPTMSSSMKPLPFFEIPSWISPGVEPITIQPEEINALWHSSWKEEVIDEVKKRMMQCAGDKRKSETQAVDMRNWQEEEKQRKERAREQREERARRGQGEK